MRNLLAVIGFIVVVKKGCELYREYSEMKREREEGAVNQERRST